MKVPRLRPPGVLWRWGNKWRQRLFRSEVYQRFRKQDLYLVSKNKNTSKSVPSMQETSWKMSTLRTPVVFSWSQLPKISGLVGDSHQMLPMPHPDNWLGVKLLILTIWPSRTCKLLHNRRASLHLRNTCFSRFFLFETLMLSSVTVLPLISTLAAKVFQWKISLRMKTLSLMWYSFSPRSRKPPGQAWESIFWAKTDLANETQMTFGCWSHWPTHMLNPLPNKHTANYEQWAWHVRSMPCPSAWCA